ncbi:hypothetical protein MHD_00750 [Mannheimia granulomatis]|uniref:LysR family transcriptional regulator n=1 Tax=Mannheimia granulomatis TaxID=85402 RepID=A0A011P691_9PAST|nr:LysR family transcriptional regulator [Mannheimia granulomatis]EXI61964.1 LysR family transcriptional regulator [Mannheimia granulomatis]RGE49365.1 hypothetical protein MHD_00750 [Mannheimia granulomatis]
MQNLNDLRAFVLVAQTQSFTKAGALLGVSASALSHTIKNLEVRLKTTLLNRTTRSISTTEAGEQLYRQLLPLLGDIEQCVNDLSRFRDTLQGRLRINANDHAFIFALWDKFQRFMSQYPEVELELISDHKFTDIVAEGFDAGIRLGSDVAKDMIAVPISTDMKMCVVGSPDYFARYGMPQTPAELVEHHCIRFRLPTSGGIMDWEFKMADSKIYKIQPYSHLIVSSSQLMKHACLNGQGLNWTPQDSVAQEISDGRLVEVLSDYSVSYEGYHLYYPNRRQGSPLFRALVDILKG